MAVSAIIGAAGLGLAIYGGIKQAQAEKKAKQNLANRPNYSPLPEDQNELNLAESQAQYGMGAGARQQLQNNTDNNLATSANAINMAGGNPNTIATLAGNVQNAYNNNAIYDDKVRQEHINNLLGTYNYYAAQRQGNADKQFQFNQYAPWADKQQLYSSQITGGQQTVNSGLNIAAKGFAGYANNSGKNHVQPQTISNRPYNAGTDVTELGNGQQAPMGESNFTNNFGSGPGNGQGGYGWNGITPFYASAN